MGVNPELQSNHVVPASNELIRLYSLKSILLLKRILEDLIVADDVYQRSRRLAYRDLRDQLLDTDERIMGASLSFNLASGLNMVPSTALLRDKLNITDLGLDLMLVKTSKANPTKGKLLRHVQGENINRGCCLKAFDMSS